jgi:hypothetical protein
MQSENKRRKKKIGQKWAQMKMDNQSGPMSLTPRNQNFFGAYFSSLFFDLT